METTGSVSSPASDRVAKILLVEDEQDVRESIKLQLEDEGSRSHRSRVWK